MENRTAERLLEAASRLITDAQWQADYLELITSPANPGVSDAARVLLNRLYDLQKKGLLTGQHEYLEAPYTYAESLKQKTGIYPSIKGVEFGGITGQTPEQLAAQRQNVVNACLDWHKNGGVITATYHAAYPGASQTWSMVQRSTTEDEFAQIITPGTALNTALLADIDSVAQYLKQLRDKDVPVLWRPYHEMNGGWFWWGQKTRYAELWEIMYDRYVIVHGLDNLLWVWSPNANNPATDAAAYYVGHDRADVLGKDIYGGDYKLDHYFELQQIGQGKLMAITECDVLPDMTRMRTRQPLYAWFMDWGKLLAQKNTDAAIRKVYTDPYAVSRGQDANPEVAQLNAADTSTGDGLIGQYYLDRNFGTLKLTKVVPKVDYDWKKSTPTGKWEMSVRWSGYLRPPFAETYTLYTNASDGVRLWVDGKLLIDDWTVHGTAERTAAITLEQGKYYTLCLDYFNGGDPADATVRFSWSSPSMPKDVIPTAYLYSN